MIFSFPKLLFVLSSIYFLVSPTNCAGQTVDEPIIQNPNHSEKEIGSIFQAPVLNALAWQSGEYLLSTKTTLDSFELEGETGGYVVDQHVLSRAAFDYEKMRYGTCSLVRANVQDFRQMNDGEPKKHTIEFMQIAYADFKTGKIYLNDSQHGYREAERNLGEEIKTFSDIPELGYVDFRGCWTLGARTEENFSRSKDLATVCENTKFKHSIKDGELKIGIRAESNSGPNYKGPFISFSFDVASSMPLRHSSYLVNVSTSERINEESVSLQWKELDGIFLPTKSVKNSMFFGIGPIQNLRLPGQEVSKIHWYHINDEKAQPELFDPETVKNLDSVLELVDPIKNKAPELSDVASANINSQPSRNSKERKTEEADN
jgi:hypothetical protein